MKNILLLLPNGFELLEAAAFTDIFGWNMVAGDHSTKLYTAGQNKDVPTSFGHTIHTNYTFAEVHSAYFEALALPGGFARYDYFSTANDDEFLRIIKEFAAENKPITAVCTASILLGKTGILNNRHATTYQGENGRWLDQLATLGAQVTTEQICIDGPIITGSGPSSAIPVALKLLEMTIGHKTAESISDMMGF